jgi:hypothetical protein
VERWDPETDPVSSISQGDTLLGREHSTSSSHLTCQVGRQST